MPNIEYHISQTILLITVIGGTGSLFASIIGAAAYVLAADWLSEIWPRWMMLLGFLLIAVTLYMQGGIWGVIKQIGALITDRRQKMSSDKNQPNRENV